MKDKASLSSLTVNQATVNFLAIEDPEEAAKQQARFVAEAIVSFDAHTLDNRGLTTSYDSSKSVGELICQM